MKGAFSPLRMLPGALVLIAAMVAVVLLWRVDPPTMTTRVEANFPGPGLMRLTQVAGRDIEVYDEAGQLMTRVNAFGHDRVDVRLAWVPGARYRLLPERGAPTLVRAPTAVPALTVRMHAPLGQPPTMRDFAQPLSGEQRMTVVIAASPGEVLDLMLEAEKRVEPGSFDLRIESELELEPAEAELQFEFDKQVWMTSLRIGEALPAVPMVVRLRVNELVIDFELHFVNRQLDATGIALERWHLPTSREAQVEARHVPGQLTLPNPLWVRVAMAFGIHPDRVNYYEPYAYQTLWLRNLTDQPASLLLVSDVVDTEDGTSLAWFASPQIEAEVSNPRILGFLQLAPGELRPAVLPVYVHPETPAGTYRRVITVQPLGTDQLLTTWSAPLGIIRTQPLYTMWLAGITLLSVAWLGAFLLWYRRLVSQLGVRLLVLLSLLGSLQFCLTFAGGMVSNLFYALLGPFNCLVGGLLTEVMTYLIITSILYIVPRVGAMTLAGIVSYLMGAIMFGAFSAMDLLFIGSAIAFREVLLFVFGVTRFGPGGHQAPNLFAMMLALGLADACTTFTNLVLQAVFYRLFFADWYILLQVVVTGFCYTLIGVWLGRHLGQSLRKVHL